MCIEKTLRKKVDKERSDMEQFLEALDKAADNMEIWKAVGSDELLMSASMTMCPMKYVPRAAVRAVGDRLQLARNKLSVLIHVLETGTLDGRALNSEALKVIRDLAEKYFGEGENGNG